MAGAYATFAAHGMYCPPRAVQSITGADRPPLALPEPGCTQVARAGDRRHRDAGAHAASSRGGTGTGAAPARPPGGRQDRHHQREPRRLVRRLHPAAGHRGLGRPARPGDGRPAADEERPHQRAAPTARCTAATCPRRCGSDVMTGALKGIPAAPFTQADPTVAEGVRTEVPDVDGLAYDAAVARLREAGFSPTRGRQTASRQKAGTVVRTSPAGGSKAATGATVYVYPSTGKAAPPSPRPTQAPRTTAPVPAPVTPPEAVVPPPAPAGPAPSPRPRSPRGPYGSERVASGAERRAYGRGDPAALGAALDLRPDDLHDRAHRPRALRAGRRHRVGDDGLQLVVGQLLRQVARRAPRPRRARARRARRPRRSGTPRRPRAASSPRGRRPRAPRRRRARGPACPRPPRCRSR